MEDKSLPFKIILACSILIALTGIFLNPSIPKAQADNTEGYPQITTIRRDDNLVNRWGDNVKITFEVQDENGVNNIDYTEIYIEDSSGITQEYDNSNENVELDGSFGDTKRFYYVFNPDNEFSTGSANVRIKAVDKENHENSSTRQDFFQVTDESISVTTEPADNITKNSATLNASIDLAGYDRVEARFYYENGTGNASLDNNTAWENTSNSSYENTIKNLEPYENYEFRASVRLPSGLADPAKDSDNGSILTLTTLTDNKPSVITKEDAKNVGYDSVTIRGELLTINWENAEVWFQWKKHSEQGWENTERNTLTSPDNFSENLTDLQSDTVYDFRAVASNPAGENIATTENFRTSIENASVKTSSATEVKKGEATLNADINYGDYSKVDIRFKYRREGTDSWQTTNWSEDYKKDNYQKKISGLETGRIYEFYSEIEFDSSNKLDEGAVLTFQSGGVSIHTEYPTNIQVNPSQMEDRFIIININNHFQEKELRDVIVEATDEKPDTGFRVFRDTYHPVGDIQPDSSQTENVTYQPINSGEKELEFTISYRVYQDNDFLYYKERRINISILVKGTEYENAIDLQVSTQNPPREWIFNGETYEAQIVVQNQRPTEVTGIKVVNENGRDIGVGSLEANASTTITIRVRPENYSLGDNNQVKLKAVHELGTSPPLNLQFGVRTENAPVGVYLVDSNSPIYLGSKLKFTLVVAGSGDSLAEDLRINSLSENVLPQGYWLGEEMKNLTQQEVSTEQVQDAIGMGSLLGGAAPSGADTSEGGEEQGKNEERAIIGRRLYFEARNLDYDDNALKFEISYELGDRVVRREFEVDYHIHHSPEVMLIQSDPVNVVEGSTATISLEIANEMEEKVQAVRVKPPENVEVTPRPVYWIGPMSPDEFLPVEFKVDTSELQDEENLKFRPVYRVGEQSVTGSPISVNVNIKESKDAPIKYYVAVSVAVVAILLLLFWYRR